MENEEQWKPLLLENKTQQDEERRIVRRMLMEEENEEKKERKETEEEKEKKKLLRLHKYLAAPFFLHGQEKLRLPPPVSSARVESIEADIAEEIKVGILNYRHTNFMKYRWLPQMTTVLRNGLITMEYEQLTGIANPVGLNAWKGDVSLQVEPNSSFVGQPLCFCYSDMKRIRHYIIDHFDFHKHKSKQAAYGIAAYVCPHYGNVCSVWVYLALVVPLVEKESTKMKGAEGGPKLGSGMPVIKRKW
jgi:hypothetical protein